MTVEIRSEKLELLPEKAIFWKQESLLVIADLHIGKAGHFRKHGIPVPRMVERNNIRRLSGILNRYNPKRIVFLGDLVHSLRNFAWDEFVNFREVFGETEMILVKGNHDIMDSRTFQSARVRVVQAMEAGPFLFTHDRYESELYNLHGHIHPCVRLKGKARQALRIPCFFFAENFGILPSFGEFTGGHPIKPSEADQVYLPVDNEIIKV